MKSMRSKGETIEYGKFPCRETGLVFRAGDRIQKRYHDYMNGVEHWLKGTITRIADQDYDGRVTVVWVKIDSHIFEEMAGLAHLQHLDVLDRLSEL